MDKILIRELRKVVKNQTEIAKINRMLSGKDNVGILEIAREVGLTLKWVDIREQHIKAVGEELRRQFQSEQNRDKPFLIDVTMDLDPLKVSLIYDNGWDVWHVASCDEDGRVTDVSDYWVKKLNGYLVEW